MNKQTLKREMNAVWEYIGGDILTAMEEQGIEPVCDRETVAELALDHMHNCHDVSEQTIAYLDSMDYNEKMAVVKDCFEFEQYGW